MNGYLCPVCNYLNYYKMCYLFIFFFVLLLLLLPMGDGNHLKNTNFF